MSFLESVVKMMDSSELTGALEAINRPNTMKYIPHGELSVHIFFLTLISFICSVFAINNAFKNNKY